MRLRDALSPYKPTAHADKYENFKVKSGSLPARNDKLEKPPGFRQCDESALIRAGLKEPVRFVIIVIDHSRPEPREIKKIIPQRVRRYSTPKNL